MFNSFRFPFNELIGEGDLGNAVAETFYISLVLSLMFYKILMILLNLHV